MVPAMIFGRRLRLPQPLHFRCFSTSAFSSPPSNYSANSSAATLNGRCLEAMKLFDEMREQGTKPNHVTLVGVLFACRHAGLVEEGKRVFFTMENLFGIKPQREHHGCMVDLLGCVGQLEEAMKFITEMDFAPDTIIWKSLLGACRVHKDSSMAAGSRRLDPDDDGAQILLANIYAGLNLFTAGENSHPDLESINKELERLIRRIDVGYVPETMFILHDVEREQKEELLEYRSEKLAIVFGLMNSITGKPIRIMKNLRICGDCHNFAKMVSKIEEQRIVIRDPMRFHHLIDGECSCGDYW